MKKIILPLLLLLIVSHIAISPLSAQTKDADIHISIDNVDIALDAFFDELGRSLEHAFEELAESGSHISITIDEERFEASMEKFGEAMEKLGEGIENAVKNMSIELRNLDAKEIKNGDGEINGRRVKDIIYEIEDEYNQEVVTVDRLFMKFKHEDIYLEMDVTLKNGKEIRNIRKTIKD